MKKTVTIGITVLNEEKNLESFLLSLVRQKSKGFILERIIIISDGSTDRTNTILKDMSARFSLIYPIIGKKRLGKPARVNQLFRLVESDALVILDGDVSVSSDNIAAKLVKPLLRKDNVELTSGKAQYFPPQTYFERIMKVGIDMWCEVKERAVNAEMYTCEGQIRAFSKKLYKQLSFPEYSADDVYPYLYCMKHYLSYEFVPSAVVFYGLPSNARDFIRQHTRFLHSKTVQSNNFTGDIIASNYVIGLRDKAVTYVRYLFRHPLHVLAYSFLLVVPKIEVNFDTDDLSAKWSIISSTKK